MIIKLKITMSAVYEADPEWYGTSDPAEMAKIDMNNPPEGLLETMLTSGNFKLIIEPLEEGE